MDPYHSKDSKSMLDLRKNVIPCFVTITREVGVEMLNIHFVAGGGFRVRFSSINIISIITVYKSDAK